MQKVSGVSLNAGVLNNSCFNETVKQWISNDKAFRFMSSIKGTPSYWKKFKAEVLAMVKQLGVPTFFLTLSCADLWWKEFFEIIQKLNEAELDISNLSYHDRCNILNSSPVLVAGHFQYRVVFFKLIIIDGPLGKSKHYAIKLEFKIRGSPHVYSFVRVIGAPELTLHNVDEYINWLDNIVSACLPDPKVDSTLYELAKT